MQLLKAVYATGTPVVVVLMNGRPLTIKWMADHIPAILETWFAGEEQGNAVADVLFGDVNPSGKLPVSLPQSIGHIPVFYNCKPSARGYYKKPGAPGKPGRDYVFATPDPLYEFGHGLSYTEFAYSDLTLSPTEIPPGGQVEVSVKVKNTGKVAGAEVVQLYLNDVVSSVTTPLRELRGFSKIRLDPGATTTVTFSLGPKDFRLLDGNLNWTVEPGVFEIMIGGLEDSFRVVPYSPGAEDVPERYRPKTE